MFTKLHNRIMVKLYHPLLASIVLFFVGCGSSPKALKDSPTHSSRIAGPDFRQVMGNVLGAPFVEGNRVETLVDGDEIFPSMLRAIRGAKRTINFETYVFDDSQIAKEFTEALNERARAGVKVSVILDANGAKKSKLYQQDMKKAGIDLVVYHPVWKNLPRYNNRTHRKLLIIDGTVGFTGGVGIADEWRGHAQNPDYWHDLHYRFTGPVVAQAQAAFMDNWLKEKGEVLHGLEYFPPLPHTGIVSAGLFHSSPEHGSRGTEIMVNLAVSSAAKSVLIENAYFVPDRTAISTLVNAAKRGVRVQIIVPGKFTDSHAVRRASQQAWAPLMDAGVEIYEYQPTMAHTKLLVVDGLFVSVGSSNLDYRSLRINAEANLNVLNVDFARKQMRIFQGDLLKSKRITREEQRRRVLKDLPLHILELPLKRLL